MSAPKNLSVGPAPRQQYQWDWRAAGNFMGGGAGAGLLLFTQLSGVKGIAAIVLVLGGLGLVGLGLFCVWLEIGRPLRAMNVFFNARTSWMSREAAGLDPRVRARPGLAGRREGLGRAAGHRRAGVPLLPGPHRAGRPRASRRGASR